MTPPAGDHYDLIVLGAGSGGYVAGIRAAQLGMSVGIVEERYWAECASTQAVFPQKRCCATLRLPPSSPTSPPHSASPVTLVSTTPAPCRAAAKLPRPGSAECIF